MPQNSQGYLEIKSWFCQLQLEQPVPSFGELEERFPSVRHGRDISDILEDLMPEGILPGA